MLTKPTDFTIRHATSRDLAAIVDLGNVVATHDNLEVTLDADHLQHMLSAPHIDLERDVFIMANENGDTIGCALGVLVPEHGRAFVEVLVHPEFRTPGTGMALLQPVENLIRTRGAAEVDPCMPLYAQYGALDTQEDALALFEGAGYAIVRYFYEMRRPLSEPITPPTLPDGLELRPFDKDAHAHAVYKAQEEVFADHWGYDTAPFEVWAHNRLNDAEQDYSLWQIAWDGDAIAGISLNAPPNNQHPNYAQTDILGVRRAWRRQGLGRALLLHSFAAFQARGWDTAGLGVDADSETNAVALYERAGMHVHRRFCTLRKVLRGDPADIED